MIQGRESIFYIKHNGIFVPISCETSNSIDESTEMLGTTTRDNEGWATSIPTMQSYGIEVAGQVKFESNSNMLSYFRLAEIKRSKQIVEWQRITLNGLYMDEGKGYITNISDSNEAEGFSTFSMSIVGYGKPILSRFVNGEFVPLLSQKDNEIIYNENNNAITTK